MSQFIEMRYGVSFGKLDSSDWIEWSVLLDGDQLKAYQRAKMLHMSLNDVPELSGVLSEAYKEIEDEVIDDLILDEDEYVIECTGRGPVDPDHINDLVWEKDPHTLEYFGLTELSEEELEEWDADDLDELPDICDFEEDFEAYSPFDEGYTLYVEFAEQPDEEDLDESEARETLKTLFKESDGDYSVIEDYVERCEDFYVGTDTLAELAEIIAQEMKHNWKYRE